MKRNNVAICLFLLIVVLVSFSFAEEQSSSHSSMSKHFADQINKLETGWQGLFNLANHSDTESDVGKASLKNEIHAVRIELKKADFWLRYLYPQEYRKLNAPLPVEWETEVFEKFEKPYRREGFGLTLAELTLDESPVDSSHLEKYLDPGMQVLKGFLADSVMDKIDIPQNFYYANRLFLLNLAAIYTTGFECPDPSRIMPEMHAMLNAVNEIQTRFQIENSEFKISKDYLDLFGEMKLFVQSQGDSILLFDHFSFIRDYVNPLYSLNQKAIRNYQFSSSNMIDFSLNDLSESIFSKDLYTAQNTTGIYGLVNDQSANYLKETGEMLFFDPILSINGKRSCAGCHQPSMYFTDTVASTSITLNRSSRLDRNTPSLMNVFQNHLLMQDGQFYQAEDQIRNVICNPTEMGCRPDEIVRNVLSCKEYKKRFSKLTSLTPAYPEITDRHILGAIIYYLNSFNQCYSYFDDAMMKKTSTVEEMKKGFNLFMGKAQCATCHFVPAFNGVKPPYVSSEFEVIGTPSDSAITMLSPDSGRFKIAPSPEMLHAFRTSTIRNVAKTKPYMHNGVFDHLHQVVAFYNDGGGAGHKLYVPNQTLSSDSLHLSEVEMQLLIFFMESLTEKMPQAKQPKQLPESSLSIYQNRKVGGEY
jgi:cytochrome c peroxidase